MSINITIPPDRSDNAAAPESFAEGPRRDDLEAWQNWIIEFADWRSFITLEFKDIVGRRKAQGCWRRLVQVLNQDLFGNHYTRIVGHSYFSYVIGYEQQERGSFHMHVIVDQPVHYQLIHDTWHVLGGDRFAWKNPGDKNHIGFAWIDQVRNRISVVNYISKYISKGGEIDIYKPRKYKSPNKNPEWWQLATRR